MHGKHEWDQWHERLGPFAVFFGGRGRHRGGGEGGRGPGGPFGFGPPGPGFPWNPFPRGPRARRGDIRAGILALLKEGPRNGYQIMQELEQRSQGLWRPSPGSIYPALQQLEDEGLVQPESAGVGRTFRLTEAGRTHVEAHPEEVAEPWRRGSPRRRECGPRGYRGGRGRGRRRRA
jgi:DNA-binding PadR family transcriptional regulator